jgi:hypothetical protein
MVFSKINEYRLSNNEMNSALDSAFVQYFREDAYPIKKVMFFMDLTDEVSYKKLDDNSGYEIMKEFYFRAEELGENRSDYFQTYWDNWSITRSTFMKFRLGENQVNIDIYRNDGFGGPYSIHKTINLEI